MLFTSLYSQIGTWTQNALRPMSPDKDQFPPPEEFLAHRRGGWATESEWAMFKASISSCSELWSEGHLCLLWRQPKGPPVDTSITGGHQAEKEVFWAWLAQGSPEAADRYQEARRAAASAVAEAETQVWKELREAMRRILGQPQVSSGKSSSGSGFF